eukprot:m.459385 g.459385  ORF g.459385 m.459385 type:complete len:139 (-) comp20341_c2_seq1:1955-2371(-)
MPTRRQQTAALLASMEDDEQAPSNANADDASAEPGLDDQLVDAPHTRGILAGLFGCHDLGLVLFATLLVMLFYAARTINKTEQPRNHGHDRVRRLSIAKPNVSLGATQVLVLYGDGPPARFLSHTPMRATTLIPRRTH